MCLELLLLHSMLSGILHPAVIGAVAARVCHWSVIEKLIGSRLFFYLTASRVHIRRDMGLSKSSPIRWLPLS